MPKIKKFTSGFTLIEALIVVSIIAIMTGGLLPTFSNYSKSQAYRQAREQVINDLYTVQANALAGLKSFTAGDPSDASNIKYWGIKFNGASYSFVTTKNSDCTNTPGSNGTVEKTYSLQTEFSVATTECVLFSVANGERAYPVSPDDYSLNINRSGGVSCSISINKPGLIKKEGTCQ